MQPSQLCDFDRSPALRKKALELVAGCRNRREKFETVFAFVKELPYGLEDWDVKASRTLKQGWGMCSGKTNLMVALLRCLGIPARYRIYRIQADAVLWTSMGSNPEVAECITELGEMRDHVDCEVWLGRWIDCDPARDSPLERGMIRLGASLERKKITDGHGRVSYLRLAVFDDWARTRQARRKVRASRSKIFTRINQEFEELRAIEKSP